MLAALACLVLLAPLVASLAAEEMGPPTHAYKPAKLGLYLPPDAQVEEEDGVWYAYSESTGLDLSFEQYPKFKAVKGMEPDALAALMADFGVEGFEFFNYVEAGGLAYAYGTGHYLDDDGAEVEGFFGLLANDSVKKKTFFFTAIVPSLEEGEGYGAAMGALSFMVPTD